MKFIRMQYDRKKENMIIAEDHNKATGSFYFGADTKVLNKGQDSRK